MRWWIVFVVFLLPGLVWGSPRVALQEAEPSIKLGLHAETWLAPPGTTAIEAAQTALTQGRFLPQKREFLNLGITPQPLWQHVILANQEAIPLTRILKLAPQDIPTQVFRLTPQGPQELSRWGEGHFFSHYQLELAPGEEVELLTQVNALHTNLSWLELQSPKVYWAEQLQSQVFAALYFGAVLIMIAYNLMLFFAAGESVYLLYVMTIGAYALFQYIAVDRARLPGLAPEAVPHVSYALALVVVLTFIGFTQKMLDTARLLPRWNRLMVTLAALATLLLLFIPFATASTLRFLVAPMGLVIPVVLIFAGIFSFQAGHRAASYYLLAWGAYLSGIGSYTLSILGFDFFGMTPFSQVWLVKVTSTGEIILLALALGEKFKAMKEEALHSKEELLRLTQDHAKTLEHKVEERTSQLVAEQSKTLSSIQYAKLIEQSQLPSLNAQFEGLRVKVRYQPRDIVGGDFYFYHQTQDQLALVLGDCTGHGVPGAMLSMVAVANFRRALVEEDRRHPGDALNRVSALMKGEIRSNQNGLDEGLEAACLIINLKTRRALFAGARTHLFWFTGQGAQLIHADRTQLGFSHSPIDYPFQSLELDLQPGQRLLLASDGIWEQPGGDRGQSFSKKRLLQIAQAHSQAPMDQQLDQIHSAWEQHRGSRAAVDDVTLVLAEVV